MRICDVFQLMPVAALPIRLWCTPKEACEPGVGPFPCSPLLTSFPSSVPLPASQSLCRLVYHSSWETTVQVVFASQAQGCVSLSHRPQHRGGRGGQVIPLCCSLAFIDIHTNVCAPLYIHALAYVHVCAHTYPTLPALSLLIFYYRTC